MKITSTTSSTSTKGVMLMPLALAGELGGGGHGAPLTPAAARDASGAVALLFSQARGELVDEHAMSATMASAREASQL
jgi:hypothetical protein